MKKTLITTILALLIIQPVMALAQGVNYRFTGQELDAESGLYNFQAREYNPNTGRFLQQDPVINNLSNPQELKNQTGQKLEDILKNPQALNSYSYTVNNPVKYVDLSGEWFGEFFTGRQSWSSFQGELGEAAMYVNPMMSKAIDHPYITGALTGAIAGLGLALAGIIAGTTPWQLAAAGSIMPITAQVAQNREQFIKVGTSFGKYGTVIKNISGNIEGFISQVTKNPLHGLDQAITRGVLPKTLIDTVSNPLVRLQQSTGNILYLTKEAVVVLDNANNLVTTYSSQYFQQPIINILKQIK